MKRRTLLAAGLGLAGLSGCAGLPGGRTETPTPTPRPTPRSDGGLAEQGFPATICETDLVDLGIYAVVEPQFADDWSSVDVADRYGPALSASDVIVGVELDGWARAYPLSVLWRHEIVNDELGDPLLVTYCSICNSGMVAERRVDGAATTFGVSGQLWKPPELYTRAAEADNRTFGATQNDEDVRVKNEGNLVLFDEATGSYWSQLLARAICGPRRGEELAILPSSASTWGTWREAHPDTDVLLPPPHSALMDPPA